MSLVDAKCTNCGAVLSVDSTKDAAICEYCGSAFIVQKAINNYNITNHNHIRAHVVNVYNAGSSDFDIRAGRLLEYRGASTNVVIPEGVSVIGARAFADLDCLKSVLIPEGVETIEYDAFCNCKNLSSISLPDSITYIEPGAFWGCVKLRQIKYSHFEYNADGFKGTPYHARWQGAKWEKEGRCGLCGGHLSRLTQKCKNCGRSFFDYDLDDI